MSKKKEKLKEAENEFPCFMYHEDFPHGKIFHNADEVIKGSVASPCLLVTKASEPGPNPSVTKG